MGLLDDYLKRADELIGDRSDGEKAYDDAELEALGSGKGIAAAIEQANAAFKFLMDNLRTPQYSIF